ncbi:uncharacterized protein LOC108903289 [Anoplophora glabripennis]|nr:uncharacterized protein LOC108903289 [Anoplophora glabripennis]
MPDTTEDILVEIPDDDLPKLLDMYEKHKNWAPYVYSIILTGIEWRRKRKEKYTIFLSPNNCWKQDGTFFVLLTVKMTEGEQDILQDIPDEDLPKLAELYDKHKNCAPYVYSTIMTGIDWRRKKKEKYLIFMSPNGCWREDGTFFVLLKYYSFDIFIFSLDDTGKNIYEGIRKTKRLDTGDFRDRPPLLYSIHNKFYQIVVKAFKDKGISMTQEIPCHMFSIPRQEALKFETKCPPEVYIKKLDTSHAELVNSEWPHRYKDSVKFVSLLIEMNEGYGLFLKSNDEMVSWALLSMLGQLTMVQTVDCHKKKGYGSLMVKYLSKIIANKGYSPFGTILEENRASIYMFQKLGFNNLGISIYSLY